MSFGSDMCLISQNSYNWTKYFKKLVIFFCLNACQVNWKINIKFEGTSNHMQFYKVTMYIMNNTITQTSNLLSTVFILNFGHKFWYLGPMFRGYLVHKLIKGFLKVLLHTGKWEKMSYNLLSPKTWFFKMSSLSSNLKS